jgi:hemoglobin-like flavoprotein
MGLKIGILEESFRLVKPRADEFVEAFYNRLFLLYPHVKPLFAGVDMKAQRKKLLGALILVMQNLRKPEELALALRELGLRHQGYGITREHYPMVGRALLETFATFLDEHWSREVEVAWTEAYEAIVSHMLNGYRAPAGVAAAPSSVPSQPAA